MVLNLLPIQVLIVNWDFLNLKDLLPFLQWAHHRVVPNTIRLVLRNQWRWLGSLNSAEMLLNLVRLNYLVIFIVEAWGITLRLLNIKFIFSLLWGTMLQRTRRFRRSFDWEKSLLHWTVHWSQVRLLDQWVVGITRLEELLILGWHRPTLHWWCPWLNWLLNLNVAHWHLVILPTIIFFLRVSVVAARGRRVWRLQIQELGSLEFAWHSVLVL